MSRSVGQNKYRRHRRQEVRRQQLQALLNVISQATDPIRRGFFGRLKWLLFGK